MNSKQLTKTIFLKLKKFKLIVLAGGLIVATLLFLYAKTLPKLYNTVATVFPLTSTNENSAASTAISQLLGGGESAKSISQEASISIVDIATSRNTRETVAMQRLAQFNNKRIAELLIENANKTKRWYAPEMKQPTDTVLLAALGGDLLNANFSARPLKSGILEVKYANTNPDLLSPITYAMIDKISRFYIDLKIKKAKQDYDFTVRKIDSLQEVLNAYDQRAVHMANTTRFVPSSKIEFSIPKENLITQKENTLGQWQAVSSNREQALWRLQKAMPIISILDKPERPFKFTKPSGMLYGIGGFVLGCLLISFLLLIPVFYKYAEMETTKAIFGDEDNEEKKPVPITTGHTPTTTA